VQKKAFTVSKYISYKYMQVLINNIFRLYTKN